MIAGNDTNHGNVTGERQREMSQCANLIGINTKSPRRIGRGSGFWSKKGMEQTAMKGQPVLGIGPSGSVPAVFGCKATLTPFGTRLPPIRSTLLRRPKRRIIHVHNRSSENDGLEGGELWTTYIDLTRLPRS